MTKKVLNQNTKYYQKIINTIEKNFTYTDRPVKRYNTAKENETNNILKKAEKLSELKNQINSIENCNLQENSKNLILGDGNANSPIMLIGEAPGEDEDSAGIPYQGEVGSLLKKMLIAINIKIENIYISYSVNFRTPQDRKPTSQEIKRYSKFLKDHISIINPKILVLLGSTAMEAITGENNKILNERGKWKEIILKNKTYPFITTYSPSYLIRFPEYKKYSWEDLKKIKQKIIDLNIKI